MLSIFSSMTLRGISPKGTWLESRWQKQDSNRDQLETTCSFCHKVSLYLDEIHIYSKVQLKLPLSSEVSSLTLLYTMTSSSLPPSLSFGTKVTCLQRWFSSDSCILMLRLWTGCPYDLHFLPIICDGSDISWQVSPQKPCNFVLSLWKYSHN